MKLPNFEVGDAVMLQTGGKHMTITDIDHQSQLATCVQPNDHQGLAEMTLPLRCLIRLSDPVESLSPGNCVTSRANWEYFSVIAFDEASGVATCAGKLSMEMIPVSHWCVCISVTTEAMFDVESRQVEQNVGKQ